MDWRIYRLWSVYNLCAYALMKVWLFLGCIVFISWCSHAPRDVVLHEQEWYSSEQLLHNVVIVKKNSMLPAQEQGFWHHLWFGVCIDYDVVLTAKHLFSSSFSEIGVSLYASWRESALVPIKNLRFHETADLALVRSSLPICTGMVQNKSSLHPNKKIGLRYPLYELSRTGYVLTLYTGLYDLLYTSDWSTIIQNFFLDPWYSGMPLFVDATELLWIVSATHTEWVQIILYTAFFDRIRGHLGSWFTHLQKTE